MNLRVLNTVVSFGLDLCMRFDMSTGVIVKRLKECSEDFEYYPTTERMLEAIKTDIVKKFGASDSGEVYDSVLDVGAGCGSALNYLTMGKKYAIEKSRTLLSLLPNDVFVVGTDFESQTLIDKRVDLVFSNPPCMTYVDWAVRLIRESQAKALYLVIPKRWESSKDIASAIKDRKAKAKVIFEGDFTQAERRARAKVHIVRIQLADQPEYYVQSGFRNYVEPFSLWFKSNFKMSIQANDLANYEVVDLVRRGVKQKINKSNKLVANSGYINVLEQLYLEDMDHLMSNYLKLAEIDSDLLSELNVNLRGVMEAVKLKIESLKSVYWNELVNRMEVITQRLTSESRDEVIGTLLEHTQVDFTVSNALAVVEWVVKNGNDYFDRQLISFVESLVGEANIVLYKSNLKTFGKDEWKYSKTPKSLDRFKLDYRVIIRADDTLVDDALTIAYNLGFDTTKTKRLSEREICFGKKEEFFYYNHTLKDWVLLFDAKWHQNNNLHLRFNQDFLCTLNVQFGFLKGWIKDNNQASDELNIELDVLDAIKGNFKILPSLAKFLIT